MTKRFQQTVSDQGKYTLCLSEIGTRLSKEQKENLKKWSKRYASDPQKDRYFRALTGSSESRLTQWESSRACLLELLNEIPEKDQDAALLSLTHSGTYSAAVVFSPSHDSKVVGVGIDLELKSRTISSGAVVKFATPAEQLFGFSAVELWTIKEALFKSVRDNKGLVVSDFLIVQRQENKARALCEKRKSLELTIELILTQDLVMAVALCSESTGL